MQHPLAKLTVAVLAIALMGQGCPGDRDAGKVVEPVPTVMEKSVSFSHTIGSTKCPTPVAEIDLRVEDGDLAHWRVQPESPVGWLNFGVTGSADQTLDLNFNCKLEKYESQNLETTLLVTLNRKDGTSKEIRVRVKGSVVKK